MDTSGFIPRYWVSWETTSFESLVVQLSSTSHIHRKFLHFLHLLMALTWKHPVCNLVNSNHHTHTHTHPPHAHPYSDAAAVQSPSGVKGNILMLILLETGTCWPRLSPSHHKDNREFNKEGLEPRDPMVPLFTTLSLLSSSCHLKDRGPALWKQQAVYIKRQRWHP